MPITEAHRILRIKAALQELKERRKADAEWSRVMTADFMDRILATLKRIGPSDDFPNFAVELNIPEAPSAVKDRLRRRLQELGIQYNGARESNNYYRAIKAAINARKRKYPTSTTSFNKV